MSEYEDVVRAARAQWPEAFLGAVLRNLSCSILNHPQFVGYRVTLNYAGRGIHVVRIGKVKQ
jgi:hypothetical protein